MFCNFKYTVAKKRSVLFFIPSQLEKISTFFSSLLMLANGERHLSRAPVASALRHACPQQLAAEERVFKDRTRHHLS